MVRPEEGWPPKRFGSTGSPNLQEVCPPRRKIDVVCDLAAARIWQSRGFGRGADGREPSAPAPNPRQRHILGGGKTRLLLKHTHIYTHIFRIGVRLKIRMNAKVTERTRAALPAVYGPREGWTSPFWRTIFSASVCVSLLDRNVRIDCLKL